MPGRTCSHEAMCDGWRIGSLVRAHARQGVVDVGDGDDASVAVDLLAFQMVGIARAVDVLVVLQGDGGEQRVVGKHLLQTLPAGFRMSLHHAPLVVTQMAGLRENLIGYGDLADVMQETAEREL